MCVARRVCVPRECAGRGAEGDRAHSPAAACLPCCARERARAAHPHTHPPRRSARPLLPPVHCCLTTHCALRRVPVLPRLCAGAALRGAGARAEQA